MRPFPFCAVNSYDFIIVANQCIECKNGFLGSRFSPAFAFSVVASAFMPAAQEMRKPTGVMKMSQRPPCSSGRYWRVEAGNTLYSIALEVGTTVDKLINVNPGIDPDNLQPGDFICLPEEFPPCPSGVFWRVSPGDTLYQISQVTGTSIDALLAANPGIDPNNLRVGQVICIP